MSSQNNVSVVRGIVINPLANPVAGTSPAINNNTPSISPEDEEKRRILEEATRRQVAEVLRDLDSSSITVFSIRFNLPFQLSYERWVKFLTCLIIGIVGVVKICDPKVCGFMVLGNVIVVLVNCYYTRAQYDVEEPKVPMVPGLKDIKVNTEISRKVYKWTIDGQTYDIFDNPEDRNDPNAKKILFRGQWVTEYDMAVAFREFQIGLGKKLDGKPIEIKERNWKEEAAKAHRTHLSEKQKAEDLVALAKLEQEAAWLVLSAKYKEECIAWSKNQISWYDFRRRILIVCDIILVIIPFIGTAYSALCPNSFPICTVSALPTLAFELVLELSIYIELNKKISFEAGTETVYKREDVVKGFAGIVGKRDSETLDQNNRNVHKV